MSNVIESNNDIASQVCSFGLIFIMFYGGFGTNWKAAKPVEVSTDAASVFAVLRSRDHNLKDGLASLLEVESESNFDTIPI